MGWYQIPENQNMTRFSLILRFFYNLNPPKCCYFFPALLLRNAGRFVCTATWKCDVLYVF